MASWIFDTASDLEQDDFKPPFYRRTVQGVESEEGIAIYNLHNIESNIHCEGISSIIFCKCVEGPDDKPTWAIRKVCIL